MSRCTRARRAESSSWSIPAPTMRRSRRRRECPPGQRRGRSICPVRQSSTGSRTLTQASSVRILVAVRPRSGPVTRLGGRQATGATQRKPMWLMPGVDHLRAAAGRAVAAAVAVGAEERAALDHLAGDPELRLRRIEAGGLVGSTGVARHAAGFLLVDVVPIGVPVGRPLPHVAGHVDEPEVVGGERPDRRCRAVAGCCPPREVTVPVVGEPLARAARADRPT